MNGKVKAIISIILSLIVITTAFIGIETLKSRSTSTADFGPKINISFAEVNNQTGQANMNVTETIQVMTENPSYIWAGNLQASGVSVAPDGAYLTLFNQTFFPNANSSTIFSGLLNSNFSKIVTGWRTYCNEHRATGMNVSMTLEASLSITVNDNLSVYTYYNNIPFNPSKIRFYSNVSPQSQTLKDWFNNTTVGISSYSSISYVPVTFNVTPEFNMQSPTYTAVLNNSNEIPYDQHAKTGSDVSYRCYPGTYYVQQWTKNLYGPDPLITMHNNVSYPTSSDYFAFSEGIITGSVDMAMNSEQTGISSGDTITNQMSTNPSWNETGKFTADGSDAIWQAYPNGGTVLGTREGINNTTGIIYVSNATYAITHYNVYQVNVHISPSGETCYRIYLGNATSIQITAINATGNNYNIDYGYVPIELYYIMQNITKGQQATSLGLLGPGKEIQGSQVWADTTGYSNGAGEIQDIKKAAATFSSFLGLAVAIIDLASALNGVDFDASEPAVVSATLGLIAASIGLSATLLGDFSTISFSTTTDFAAQLYVVENAGTSYTYNLIDYQSPNPVTFGANGDTYSFNAPSNFLVGLSS
jgi:hypothetical protein